VKSDLRRRLLADLALLGITLIWGATFVIVKEALESVSTLLFLALRFSLAAAVLALLFGPRLLSERPSRDTLRAAAIVGVFLFLGYLFQTLGLRRTTPARSAFLTGLAVVLVPLYASMADRRLPSPSIWAGAGTAAAGLYLLAAPEGRWDLGRGEWLTLACAAAFGLHILLLGKLSPKTGVASLAFGQVAVTAALALMAFPWAEPPLLRWSGPLVLAVAVTGLLATALAFSVQTWAQRFTPPAHAALIFAMEPVFAAITSYLTLGESLGTQGWAGAGLILAGILLAELKPW
jgi:drug/metabolite transporter (DMT)-like permease